MVRYDKLCDLIIIPISLLVALAWERFLEGLDD